MGLKWDDYGVDEDLTTTPSKPAKFPRNRDPPTEMPPVGTKSHNGTTFAILSFGDKTEVLFSNMEINGYFCFIPEKQ